MNKTKLKIIHVNNLAFVSTITATFQRRLGYNSQVITSYFGIGEENELRRSLRGDIHVSAKKWHLWHRLIIALKLMVYIGKHADILHLHYNTYFPFNLDIIYWKICGLKMIYHYHGGDIRGKREFCISKFLCDKRFVSTPDLLEWVSKDVKWLPNPIDIDNIREIVLSHSCMPIKTNSNSIRIVHAPTDRKKKGTEYVLDAIDKLKHDGFNIELILLEGNSHEDVLLSLRDADIVVDQLILGWYGVFTMEAMALGKPVCVYISESLQQYIPENTIINVNPTNIYDCLKNLINNPEYLSLVGSNAKSYVENIHGENAINEYYDEMYNEILTGVLDN